MTTDFFVKNITDVEHGGRIMITIYFFNGRHITIEVPYMTDAMLKATFSDLHDPNIPNIYVIRGKDETIYVPRSQVMLVKYQKSNNGPLADDSSASSDESLTDIQSALDDDSSKTIDIQNN